MKSNPGPRFVFVADGERAMLLKATGAAGAPRLEVLARMDEKHAADRDLGTDRPGRRNGAPGASRGAIEETDYHQQAEDRFAARLVEDLVTYDRDESLDGLLVMAAPKTLAILRDRLPKTVADKVVGEVPKDFSHSTLEQISTAVAAFTSASGGHPG